MINKTEKEERDYLEQVKQKLLDEINRTEGNIDALSGNVKDYKDYLWENRAGMDHAEKVSVRQSIWQTALTGETAALKKRRLEKLLSSPWFGRIDFTEEGSNEKVPVYIGVHAFFDPKSNSNVIYDWRAPVSGLFYDYELGQATFNSPSGTISGEIHLKRQYRIRNGEMEFMLESSLNIHDEILQQELSGTTDEKMKNIVATIQRDQNRIIRNEHSHALVIQGVAGSGKTSIALHRIAYMLYKYRDTITSRDILIISPNRVFSDYISNVLPELGEEKIEETGMEDLAAKLLGKKYRFRTFIDQVSKMIEGKDKAFIERTRYKASHELTGKLDQFLVHVENEYFVPNDLKVGRYYVPYTLVAQKYLAFSRVPLFKRFAAIAQQVSEFIEKTHRTDLSTADIRKIESDIRNMLRYTSLRDIYKSFYDWLGRPEYFRTGKGGLEWADVYPMIYLQIRLEGSKTFNGVKHLLVDEMQDYTPVQYSVLAKIFPCRKTILGDAGQSVTPWGPTSANDIEKVLVNADIVKLFKSYRSTVEITRFTQNICRNDELVPVERHGEKPAVTLYSNESEEVAAISSIIAIFSNSGYNSLGIICKTQKEADRLFDMIKSHPPGVYLLNSESVAFITGAVITAVHMAKGLEFDQVIVPFATRGNYHTETDRKLLYIACTRAMHKLDVTCTGKSSEFLQAQSRKE
ncbi:MAG: helicase [Marinilabiliales bacterium]|nr:MAG: helicase [Marinilabiliales bacterium]